MLVCASLLQVKAEYSAYYRDALRYLGCVNLEDIPRT